MFKRILGAGALTIGVIAALVGCEAAQINWGNHFYVMSNACAPSPLTAGATTLRNGAGVIGTPGTLGGTRVTLQSVHYGDLTHDGIQDAAVFLNCHDTIGGNHNGSEIQIFTRDAKPVARLIAPDKYGSGSPFPPYFIYNEIQIIDNTLYTGIESYLAGDAHASPSEHDLYRWDWNGHGFTAVDVTPTVTLGGARLTLPAGWVAERVASSTQSHPILPTWCLMPHSGPAPASSDAANCTIAFSAAPTGPSAPALTVDTPGGLAGNPEYCDPAHPQTISLLGKQESTLGARPASYRNWLYACADGTRWPVEQYVVATAPAYVLYSSHATPAVHALMTNIAKTAQLPAI